MLINKKEVRGQPDFITQNHIRIKWFSSAYRKETGQEANDYG